jgi:hypothetical protein
VKIEAFSDPVEAVVALARSLGSGRLAAIAAEDPPVFEPLAEAALPPGGA